MMSIFLIFVVDMRADWKKLAGLFTIVALLTAAEVDPTESIDPFSSLQLIPTLVVGSFVAVLAALIPVPRLATRNSSLLKQVTMKRCHTVLETLTHTFFLTAHYQNKSYRMSSRAVPSRNEPDLIQHGTPTTSRAKERSKSLLWNSTSSVIENVHQVVVVAAAHLDVLVEDLNKMTASSRQMLWETTLLRCFPAYVLFPSLTSSTSSVIHPHSGSSLPSAVSLRHHEAQLVQLQRLVEALRALYSSVQFLKDCRAEDVLVFRKHLHSPFRKLLARACVILTGQIPAISPTHTSSRLSIYRSKQPRANSTPAVHSRSFSTDQRPKTLARVSSFRLFSSPLLQHHTHSTSTLEHFFFADDDVNEEMGSDKDEASVSFLREDGVIKDGKLEETNTNIQDVDDEGGWMSLAEEIEVGFENARKAVFYSPTSTSRVDIQLDPTALGNGPILDDILALSYFTFKMLLLCDVLQRLDYLSVSSSSYGAFDVNQSYLKKRKRNEKLSKMKGTINELESIRNNNTAKERAGEPAQPTNQNADQIINLEMPTSSSNPIKKSKTRLMIEKREKQSKKELFLSFASLFMFATPICQSLTNRESLLAAGRVTVACTLAALIVFIPYFQEAFHFGLWAPLTVIFVMNPQSFGATLHTSSLRMQGTAAGALFGYFTVLIANGNEAITCVCVFVWVTLSGYVRSSEKHSYAGVVAAFTAMVIIFLETPEDEMEGLGVGGVAGITFSRLVQTWIGVMLVMCVKLISKPSRATKELKQRIIKSLEVSQECVAAEFETFVNAGEYMVDQDVVQGLIRNTETEIKKASQCLEQAELEPQLWNRPLEPGNYHKLIILLKELQYVLKTLNICTLAALRVGTGDQFQVFVAPMKESIKEIEDSNVKRLDTLIYGLSHGERPEEFQFQVLLQTALRRCYFTFTEEARRAREKAEATSPQGEMICTTTDLITFLSVLFAFRMLVGAVIPLWRTVMKILVLENDKNAIKYGYNVSDL